MAEAAESRFHPLRGLMRWPRRKPAVSAAEGLSKTFTSYLAARSFGCISLLVLLRQRVAPVAEDLAEAPLVGRLEDLEAVGAALRELLALDLGELRQVARRPLVLHELQRVVLPQGVAVPVLRQQQAPEVGVIVEADAEQIVRLALHPVSSGPDGCHAVDAGLARPRLQPHA